MARRDADPRERCACGHTREAHEHYRRGTDCALCGAEVCGRFRGTGVVVVDVDEP